MRLSRERIGAPGNMDVGGARRVIRPGLRPGLRRSSAAGFAVRCRQNFGQIKSEWRSDKIRTAVKCGQILHQIKQEFEIGGLGATPAGDEARTTIEELTNAMPGPSSDDQDSFRTSLTAALDQIDVDAPLWEPSTVEALESVDTVLTTWIDAEAGRAELLTSEREHLTQVVARAKQGNPMDVARTRVLIGARVRCRSAR